MRMSEIRNGEVGFTLIETAIVFSIMILTVVMAVPIYSSAIDVAEETTAIEDIKLIANAVDTFALNNGQLPDSLAQIGMNHLRDPWGNPYIYKRIAGTALDQSHGGRGRGGVVAAVVTVPVVTIAADGTVLIDRDADGVIDMKAPKLSRVLLEKLSVYVQRTHPSGSALNTDYDLFSPGEDGDTADKVDAPEAEDDIIRAGNGGVIERGDKL